MSQDRFNLELRSEILIRSLMLESLLSILLSWLLNIGSRSESISFGNKSTALSFNQKINLLIDIGALTKAQRDKFIKFMEIRNQFIHSISVRSFEKCCKNIKGLDIYLLKNFPGYNLNDSDEDKLRFSFDKLVDEVFSMVDMIDDALKRKVNTDSVNHVNLISNKAFAQSIKPLSEFIMKYLNDFTDENGNIKASDLSRLPKDFNKQLAIEWKKQYDEIENKFKAPL